MSHIITPDDYDIEEFCPVCDTMNPVKLDPEDHRCYVTCSGCGRLLMLCTCCHDLTGGTCNWTEENGCRMRNQPINWREDEQ